MNKKLGIPVAALIAAAVIAAALVGALLATALDGEGEDDGDAVVLTTTAAPAAATQSTDDDGDDDDVNVNPVIDHDEQPLSPAEADRVARAALRITGGGTVTELGRSDDPGEAYEVEVQTDAGEVDIALDADLNRVSNNPYDD